jgi:TetR/AcrR family transcriptional repressor of nem operon
MGRVSDAKERLMEAVKELIWTGSYGTTTIDQICDKAKVKKGSFYYFFEGKADLAVTAINDDWPKRRAELDTIFSPTVPPLERLKKYCEFNYRFQAEIRAKCGCVLGCPLFCLGSEVSTQEVRLQQKIEEILDHKRKYFESAIRDAVAEGLVVAQDIPAKARMLFAYYQGLVTEARIRDDLEILKDAIKGTYELLGVREPAVSAA